MRREQLERASPFANIFILLFLLLTRRLGVAHVFNNNNNNNRKEEERQETGTSQNWMESLVNVVLNVINMLEQLFISRTHTHKGNPSPYERTQRTAHQTFVGCSHFVRTRRTYSNLCSLNDNTPVFCAFSSFCTTTFRPVLLCGCVFPILLFCCRRLLYLAVDTMLASQHSKYLQTLLLLRLLCSLLSVFRLQSFPNSLFCLVYILRLVDFENFTQFTVGCFELLYVLIYNFCLSCAFFAFLPLASLSWPSYQRGASKRFFRPSAVLALVLTLQRDWQQTNKTTKSDEFRIRESLLAV